jgi:hypothetical protein
LGTLQTVEELNILGKNVLINFSNVIITDGNNGRTDRRQRHDVQWQ